MTIPAGTLVLQSAPAAGPSTASKTAVQFRPTEAVVDCLAECLKNSNEANISIDFDQGRLFIGDKSFAFRQNSETQRHDLILLTTVPGRNTPSVRVHCPIIAKAVVDPSPEDGLPDRAREQTLVAESAKHAKRTIMLNANAPPPPPLAEAAPPKKGKTKVTKKAGATSSLTAAAKRANANATIPAKNTGASIPAKNESGKPSPALASRVVSSTATSTPSTPVPQSIPISTNNESTLSGKRRAFAIHLAIRGHLSRDEIMEKMPKRTEAEISALIHEIAEPTRPPQTKGYAPGQTVYKLKTRFWKEMRPYGWTNNLSDSQRNHIAEQATEVLTALGIPTTDPVWEHFTPRPSHATPAAEPKPRAPKQGPTSQAGTTTAAATKAPAPAAARTQQPVPAKRGEAQSAPAARPVKAGMKRERERELGEIDEELESAAAAPTMSRVSSVATKIVRRDDNGTSASPRVKHATATVPRDEAPPKKKFKEDHADSDMERERRREEKRRRLDADEGVRVKARDAAREPAHERARETPVERDRATRDRERSASPPRRRKHQRSVSPQASYERSASPVPVKRKPKREPSPPPPAKMRREPSPPPKPAKVKHQRAESSASSSKGSKQKRSQPDYTSSDDDDEPRASVRAKTNGSGNGALASAAFSTVPTLQRETGLHLDGSLPLDRQDRDLLERLYKKGWRIYQTLYRKLQLQYSLNEAALDDEDSPLEEILDEKSLRQLVSQYDTWHGELLLVRRAMETVSS